MTDSEEEARVAFKEKLRSLAFGFVGGREQFHGPTIGERQRDIITRAKQNGYNPEPIGYKTYTGR